MPIHNGMMIFDCDKCDYSMKARSPGAIKIAKRLHTRKCGKEGRTVNPIRDDVAKRQAKELGCHVSQINAIQVDEGSIRGGKIINDSYSTMCKMLSGKDATKGKGVRRTPEEIIFARDSKSYNGVAKDLKLTWGHDPDDCEAIKINLSVEGGEYSHVAKNTQTRGVNTLDKDDFTVSK